MTIPVRALWTRQRTISIVFLLMAFLTLIFALRFVLSVFYWHNPEHRQIELKGWMTLGQVAMIYHIPTEDLTETFQLAPTSGQRLTLRQIAKAKGMTIEQFETEIVNAMEKYEGTKADIDE